ncbi:MLO-like protein 1 [Apostasia shenzhenica]|uniref:MLO-like protein 1 n=1 Tax=Apostasia shenzhenica TaxID=1088818 RepID=A0A2H9ZVT9_9ASPA|nr:MLO-like protein 1 [Apostasia shenzhenica]
MGSSFKPAIFEEHVQQGLVEWAKKVKKKTTRVSSSAKAEGFQFQSISTPERPLMKYNEDEIVEESLE